ncbi:MAG: hypothetical protein JNM56_30550 [Planctomycetia bacterium]|nr:hypothetical protein [Planctomycetia bacterium]
MSLVVPTWFKQRQGKAEAAGDLAYKLTAPNLRPGFVVLRADDSTHYAAAVREAADGPDLSATPPEFCNPKEAWDAAFELYRRAFIV